MHRYPAFLTLLLWLPIAFACKKDASHASNTCKIVFVQDSIFSSTGTYTSTTRMVYDNDGRMAYTRIKWPTDSATRVFTYYDSAIMITPTTDLMSFDTVILNDKGLAARISVTFAGLPSTVLTYSYDPAGVLETSTVGSTTTKYQVVNGDCIGTTSSDGTVSSFTYFTDRAAADGDPQRFSDLATYGVIIHRNAHLTRSARYGTYYVEYNYTFDKAGRITSTTSRAGAQVNKSTFEYDCP
jgi:hypothetical protein